MLGLERYDIRENAYKRKPIPYKDDGEYEDPTCSTIDLFNSKLSTWKYGSEEDPDNAIAKFLDITRDLSSILTDISDDSLFEIDDVLYADYEVSQCREKSSSKSKYLDCLAMEDYNKCYKMILEMGYSNHELDTLYLRLAENLGGIHFEWIFYELGWSGDERKICLFLKIFMSCLKVEDDIPFFIINEFADEIGVPFFLLKLRQFPQPSDSKNKRIVEFIIKQAGACLNAFDNTKMLKGPIKFIEDSINYFLDFDFVWLPYYQYIMLDVFMSAKNSNERKEFLKAFIRALNTSTIREFKSLFHIFGLIFVSVSKNLISIAGDIVKDKCCEEDMRYIDQHCGYNIGTYWSECVDHEKEKKMAVMVTTDSQNKSKIVNIDEEETCSFSLDIATGIPELVQNSDYFGEKSDVNSFSEESDIDSQKHHTVKSYFENLKAKNIKDLKDEYIFKKFLIYDDFMKCLHLMSILHTAITEYEVISKFCQDEPFALGFELPDLDCSKYCHMYEMDMLSSDLKNKKVSWPLEMAVTKCPFLYLKKNAFHLNMEYLKYLKGEQIDEATEREISFNRKIYKNNMELF